MRIDKDLKEATLLKINTLSDIRGYLTPLTDSIDTSLLNRMCLVGNSVRGVKRGIHYHKKEWKIYSVVTGSAKFISVHNQDNCHKCSFSCGIYYTRGARKWLDKLRGRYEYRFSK